MAATYTDRFNLVRDTNVRNQIVVACAFAAHGVLLEDPATLNHANRLKWAKALAGAGAPIVDTMMWGIALSGLADGYAANRMLADGDIQATVSALINDAANALA